MSAVGILVGESIEEGVKSSDLLGVSKFGTASVLFEGDVGIGTAVINLACACIGNALVGILTPVTAASEYKSKVSYFEADPAIILVGDSVGTSYVNNPILDSNVRAGSPG